MLGGRWKTLIVYYLLAEASGFGQLFRKLAECPERVLTRQLRELERDGVIARRGLGGKPPRVEYALTPLGGELAEVFRALGVWGERHAASGVEVVAPAASRHLQPATLATKPARPTKPILRRSA